MDTNTVSTTAPTAPEPSRTTSASADRTHGSPCMDLVTTASCTAPCICCGRALQAGDLQMSLSGGAAHAACAAVAMVQPIATAGCGGRGSRGAGNAEKSQPADESPAVDNHP
jgi:hypothetical protein